MDDERPTPAPEAPRVLDVEKVCAENARNIVKWLMGHGIRRAEVGDVSQEVFKTVLQVWDSYDPTMGDVQGWLYGVTRKIASNYHRRARRRLRLLLSVNDADMAPPSTPENIVKQKRDSEFLWSVIETLEEDRREVVIAHLNGLTLAATATALDTPLSTVHERLMSAKHTIQAAFIARDRPRFRRGVLPLLPAIDVLLNAERARLDAAVPADAVVEARAALDQVLSDLGRGPSSGVRDAPSREKVEDPTQQRLARLLRRIRPFVTTSVLGALAVIAPWDDQALGASAPAMPSITREIAAPVVAPASGRPAEDSTAQAPTLRRPIAGAHVEKRSVASSSSSTLAREQMEAVIRAMRRGDSSAPSASGERAGAPPAELSEAQKLLQRRKGR
jgi:RNA polymerase sigma factor (sigma-70 family)